METFLSQAFTGADELFLVTDFMGAGFSYDAELKQGKNAIDAAKEVDALNDFHRGGGMSDYSTFRARSICKSPVCRSRMARVSTKIY